MAARARRADAKPSSSPGARCLDRLPGPIIQRPALFEQCEHVVGTVGRPEGKLPMSIQVEQTAPMNGLEARVSHADFTIKLRMSSTPWFTDYTAILAHNFMRFVH